MGTSYTLISATNINNVAAASQTRISLMPLSLVDIFFPITKIPFVPTNYSTTGIANFRSALQDRINTILTRMENCRRYQGPPRRGKRVLMIQEILLSRPGKFIRFTRKKKTSIQGTWPGCESAQAHSFNRGPLSGSVTKLSYTVQFSPNDILSQIVFSSLTRFPNCAITLKI